MQFTLLFLIFQVKSEKENSGIINLNFTYLKGDELLKVLVRIGDPPQNIEMILDLSSERTWVSDEIYLSNNSKDYKTDKFIDSREMFDI